MGTLLPAANGSWLDVNWTTIKLTLMTDLCLRKRVKSSVLKITEGVEMPSSVPETTSAPLIEQHRASGSMTPPTHAAGLQALHPVHAIVAVYLTPVLVRILRRFCF